MYFSRDLDQLLRHILEISDFHENFELDKSTKMQLLFSENLLKCNIKRLYTMVALPYPRNVYIVRKSRFSLQYFAIFFKCQNYQNLEIIYTNCGTCYTILESADATIV